LIKNLANQVNTSPVVLATGAETTRNEQFTEGEWLNRVETFIKHDDNNIPNTPLAKALTTALLTKAYANHLSIKLVTKLTEPLDERPKAAGKVKILNPAAKAKAVAKVKKAIAKK
jgi:hypothetical protein